MKKCSNCNIIKPLTEYYKTNKSTCKECRKEKVREYKRNNPGYHRKSVLLKQYGLTLEEYENLRIEQNYCCKICGKHESLNQHGKLDIDHCHTNGHVRGLLCTQCNTAIGLLSDDENRIRKAADYVRNTAKT